MRELVEYLAKNLADEPDKVTVVQEEEDDAYVLSLRVAEEDMGRVIGKQGRIAKAIRTVVKAASLKSPKKYVVDIVSNEELEA